MHLLSSRRTHSLWAALVGLLVTCGGFAQVQPDCASASVRCVGAGREYTSIGAAAAAVRPGDLVYVFDGSYTGFRVTVSGSASAPIVFRAGGNNVVISSSGPTGDGIRFDNVSYVTVDGFHIQNVSQRCIAARNGSPTAPMVGLTIRNNSCTAAGLEGFYLSEVKSSLVENNVVFGLTKPRGHGIYLANAGTDNTTVRNNRIYNISGTDAAGIHANGDLSVGGDGIISGVVLDGNLIYSIAFNGVSFDGVQNAILRNNVIYGTARHAVRAFRIDGAQGPKGLTIVNNTLVSAGAWAIKLTEDLGGHVVFNNILLGGGSGGSLAVANTNLKSAANVIGARFSRDGEQTTVNLAAWQSWGYDTGSVTGSTTQLFRNPSAGDYHLNAGAPAVNRGLGSFAGMVAPAVDRDGITRPQGGAFDAGAYELGGAGTSPGGDTTAPTISMTAPSVGATVSATTTLSASASDNVSVAGVQFQVDGVNYGAEDTAAPYSVSWNTSIVSNGSHSLRAVARDAAGNRTTSAILTVTVNNALAPSPLDTILPQVTLTRPASGSVTGSISLAATAMDNVGVVSVAFRVDGFDIGAPLTLSPYQTTWNSATVSNGSHVVTAVARDAAGNAATSAGVTVTVNNSTTSQAGTYYVSTTGNDSSAGTAAAPWATFTKAWSVLQPGNTLILKSGTYKQDLSPKKSGTVSQPITVKAEVDGTVYIDGEGKRSVLSLSGNSYLTFEGLTLERSNDAVLDVYSAGKGLTSHHNTFRRIGAYCTSTSTEGCVVAEDGSHHNVFEDLWIWGTGRYKFLLYGRAGGNPPNLDAPYNTLRRIVIRYDAHPATSGNPQASVGVYSVTNTVIENVIAVDGLPASTEVNAAFYVTGHSPSSTSDNRFFGILALNGRDWGMQIDADGLADRNKITDAVIWGNANFGGLVFHGNLHDNACNRCTIAASGDYGIYNDAANTTLKNSVVMNSVRAGIDNSSGSMALGYNDVYNNAGGAYSGVSRGSTDLNPAVNPGIQYLTRAGAGVRGKAEGGSDIGASLMNRYQDGVLTSTPLWPWPNQDRIKKEMCSDSGVTRGFCGKASLTDYVWSFAGSPTPSNVSTVP